MSIASRWRLVLTGALLLAWAAGAADPVNVSKSNSAKPGLRADDLWRLLPGAVIVAVGEVQNALQQPGVVLLSPEEWKKLQDQLDQLKRLVHADKPVPPAKCSLSGQVETTAAGDIVRLTADFEFATEQAKAKVALGCGNAWPTGVTLDDGALPLLPPPGDDGFVVQVETPGEHRLRLTLEVPLGIRGSDRVFELSLPRAAITELAQLDVPETTRDKVKVVGLLNKKPTSASFQVPPQQLHSRSGKREKVYLGAVDQLEVSWKGPPARQPGEALLAAQGQVAVTVDDANVTTRADLTLNVLRGQTQTWRIAAPPTASLELRGAAAEDGTATITPPPANAKPPSVWMIKLKEPSADAVQLELRIRQPRAGKLAPVGPFTVLGAVRQQGTITVKAPADVRLRYHSRGDISQRELTDELRADGTTVASFSYWSLPQPMPEKPAQGPLDLEIEAVKGAVESRITHHLNLVSTGWRLKSAFHVNPVRTGVERLEIDLPAGLQDAQIVEVNLAEPLEVKEGDPASPTIGLIKLASEHRKEFTITLEGLYPLAGPLEKASLQLPRPRGTLDRGGELQVTVPPDLEVAASQSGSDLARPGSQPLSWQTERAPTTVDLSWRRYRPDQPVQFEIDVKLNEEKKARVSQTLFYPASSRGPFRLHGPAGLAKPTLVTAGKLEPRDPPGSWEVTPTDTVLGRENVVSLEYSFPLPDLNPEARSRRFNLPLIWPEQATQGTAKVRVWCPPGTQPVLAGGTWEELPTELVLGRDGLPALVLRGSVLEEAHQAPLTLAVSEPIVAPLPTVVVERVLVQSAVVEGGHQTYRARFRLSRLHTPFLRIELPGPSASLSREILLDGIPITNITTVDESDQEVANGRILRLGINPELYQNQPAVLLDLLYHLPPALQPEPRLGMLEGWRLQTGFAPPRLRGDVLVGRVRWQLALPGDWVVLTSAGGAVVEQRWGRRGWLLGPVPAVGGDDLEHWFNGPDAPPEASSAGTPSLVCWQSAVQPLWLVHLPQQVWLIACSLMVLAVGLGLYYLPLSRVQWGTAIGGLGLLVVAVGILWPNVLPALVYGSEPGAAVLLLVLGVQWMLHRRYRRQIVFMPGFTRLKTGSSLIRTNSGSSNRPRGEPSTIDAPPSGSLS